MKAKDKIGIKIGCPWKDDNDVEDDYVNNGDDDDVNDDNSGDDDA